MKKKKPSPTELAILKALWTKSPLTAKEIHACIAKKLNWSFSSTRKTLDRMKAKAYLGCHTDRAEGVLVYKARVSKVATLAYFAADFAKRVMEIDEPLPVSMFVDSKILNNAEQKELENLLETLQSSENDE